MTRIRSVVIPRFPVTPVFLSHPRAGGDLANLTRYQVPASAGGLALFPGQAIETPATDGAAMVMIVELAFETMHDIVNVLETMLDE